MIRQHRRSFKVLRQVSDLSLLLALYYAWLYFTSRLFNPLGIPVAWSPEYLRLPVFLLFTWSGALLLSGAYGNTRRHSAWRALGVSARTVALNVLFFSIAVFVFKIQFISRRFFFGYTVLAFALLTLTKASEFRLLEALRRFGFNTLSVVLVGEGVQLQAALKEFEAHSEWGYRVVGVLGAKGAKGKGAARSLGPVSRLEQVLRSRVVDLVVLAGKERSGPEFEKALSLCAMLGAPVFSLIPAGGGMLRPTLDSLGDLQALRYAAQEQDPYAHMVKAVFDRVAAALLLLLLSPLLVAVALAIVLTMGRPVFFLQKRLGLNGRAFRIFKFRTMVLDARQKQDELADENVMGGPVFKVKNDPRITPLGRFLRKSSIDELPQLINVLLGDISIVGPRPLPTYEARKVPSWAWRRYAVKPGITCYWQVSGRNNISFEQWMRLDLKYIDEWSLGLDVVLMAKTVPAVLFSRGAY